MPMNRPRSASNALSASTLGELELRVLKLLWEQPGLDAKQICGRLSAPVPSLSTVQSTLERLHRKQLLARVKHGYAYTYSCSVSRPDLLARLMGDVIQLLHDGRMETILSSFVNVAADLDERSLDDLEMMVLAKKREQEGGNDA